jgi:hypothetical protein
MILEAENDPLHDALEVLALGNGPCDTVRQLQPLDLRLALGMRAVTSQFVWSARIPGSTALSTR